jgi:hypothetical protein
MSGALERVLRLVEEGRLTAEEAAPILDALSARTGSAAATPGAEPGTDGPADPRPARTARIEVYERGRKRIDLRVPISLGRLGIDRIPGISSDQVAAIRAAIDANRHGPILDVEDPDGDGVRIVLD